MSHNMKSLVIYKWKSTSTFGWIGIQDKRHNQGFVNAYLETNFTELGIWWDYARNMSFVKYELIIISKCDEAHKYTLEIL